MLIKLLSAGISRGMAEGLGGASCEPRGQVVGLRFSANAFFMPLD